MVDKFKADVGAKSFTVKAKTAQDGTVTLRAKRDGVRGINFSSVQNRMKEELKKEVDKAGEDAKGLKKAGARIKGFFKGAKKVLQHSANKRLGQIKSEDMDVISATRATVSRTASAEKELEKKGFTREDLPREDILNTLLKSEPNAGASIQDQLHADVNSVIQNFAEMTYGKKVAGQLNPEADFTDMKTLEGRAAIVKEDIENQKKAAAEARKVKAEKFGTDIKDAAPDIINTYFHEFDHFWNNDGKLNGELQERIEGKLRKLGAESKECTADHKFAFNKPEIRAEMLAPILDRLEKANNAKLPGLEHLQEALNTLREKGALTSEAQAEAQEKITADFEKFKHTAKNIQNYRNELSPEKPTEVRKNIRLWKIIQDALKTKPSAKTANEALAPNPAKTSSDESAAPNPAKTSSDESAAPNPAKTSSDASASNLPARPELVPSPFDTDADSEIQPASPRASASPRDRQQSASSELSATPTVTLPTGRMRAQQPVVPSLAVPDPLAPSVKDSDSDSFPLPGTTYQTDVNDTNTQFTRSPLFIAGNVNPAIDNAPGDLTRSASVVSFTGETEDTSRTQNNTYTPLDGLGDTGSGAAASPTDEKKNPQLP